uniref:Uncharacterized protein n=1 Tax=Myotis myotis TaxID=51298 RepID=A0A7J7SC42_MYOMY|nr:hypothetical protein mMyoMyo1_009497 [Myotis myotis]
MRYLREALEEGGPYTHPWSFLRNALVETRAITGAQQRGWGRDTPACTTFQHTAGKPAAQLCLLSDIARAADATHTHTHTHTPERLTTFTPHTQTTRFTGPLMIFQTCVQWLHQHRLFSGTFQGGIPSGTHSSTGWICDYQA